MDLTQIILAVLALIGAGATAIWRVLVWFLSRLEGKDAANALLIEKKDRESHDLLQEQATYFRQQLEIAHETLNSLFETVRVDREASRKVIQGITDGYKEHTDISKKMADNQRDQTRAIADLAAQVQRLVERIDRLENKKS